MIAMENVVEALRTVLAVGEAVVEAVAENCMWSCRGCDGGYEDGADGGYCGGCVYGTAESRIFYRTPAGYTAEKKTRRKRNRGCQELLTVSHRPPPPSRPALSGLAERRPPPPTARN